MPATIEIVLTTDPRLSKSMDTEAYIKTLDPSLIEDEDESSPAMRFLVQATSYKFALHELSYALDNAVLVENALKACVVGYRLGKDVVMCTTRKPGRHKQLEADTEWVERLCKMIGIGGANNLAGLVVKYASMPEDQRPTSAS